MWKECGSDYLLSSLKDSDPMWMMLTIPPVECPAGVYRGRYLGETQCAISGTAVHVSVRHIISASWTRSLTSVYLDAV